MAATTGRRRWRREALAWALAGGLALLVVLLSTMDGGGAEAPAQDPAPQPGSAQPGVNP